MLKISNMIQTFNPIIPFSRFDQQWSSENYKFCFYTILLFVYDEVSISML